MAYTFIMTFDNSQKFVPDALTHLYHTSCYDHLSERQRLKYNHLFGLRINEQFIMFEEVFIRALMPRLKRHRCVKNNPQMLDDIDSILIDEEQHSEMFARFNKRIRPDLYLLNREHFTRLSVIEKGMFRLFMNTPGLLPALLWLLLAMEELTTAISAELINHPQSSALDENFITMHQHHLHDEKRHVGIDIKIVQNILENTSVQGNRINAILFRNVLGSILKPRRSTVQVIRQLASDEPELRKHVATMIAEITALQSHIAFPANLITTEKLPVLHTLSTRYPEYQLPTATPAT